MHEYLRIELLGPNGSSFLRTRPFNTLSLHWWWEGMFADVVQFVNLQLPRVCCGAERKRVMGGHVCRCGAVCEQLPRVCCGAKGKRVIRLPLHPIPVKRLFQIVGVDIINLPLRTQGDKYVLVFQDFLTKWSIFYSIPDQKSQRIAEFLVRLLIPFFGVSESLLSDHGANLLSHLILDVC